MLDTEILRIIIAVSMLSVASYFDYKNRTVHDGVWVVFGGAGSLLYLADFPTFLSLGSVVFSTVIAAVAWRFKLFGGADALGLIAFAVIIPEINGVLIPISMLVLALAISTVYSILRNISSNIARGMNGERLFSEFDESVYRKCIAFFFVHKKSENEKFSFPASVIVDERLKFRFFNNAETEFAENDTFVSTTVPLMISYLISTIILILGLYIM